MPIVGGRANLKRNEDNSRSDNRRDFTFVRYLRLVIPLFFLYRGFGTEVTCLHG